MQRLGSRMKQMSSTSSSHGHWHGFVVQTPATWSDQDFPILDSRYSWQVLSDSEVEAELQQQELNATEGRAGMR